MPSGKRSMPDPERRKELDRKDSVYVITCGIDGCPCGLKEGRCERGFFSLFLQVLYGMEFANRNHIPYHVDFTNRPYCYSDHGTGEENFWNAYFEQPIVTLPHHLVPVPNRFYELYPLTIWDRSHFRRMNEYVKRLTFKPGVQSHIEVACAPLLSRKALGVHVRRTDHFQSVRPVKLSSYLTTVDRLVDGFELLFVSTDDTNVLRTFRQRYGKKVHANPVARSSDSNPVHLSAEIKDRWRLGLDALTDCICLAKCRTLVLTYSNVSYTAMLFNPELPYVLMERPQTKWRRYKTLIVYFLDKWGLRKW